jgi:hypothetical protein
MPVCGFSEEWNLYLTFNGILTLNDTLSDVSGSGAGINAQFIYSNEDWWPGAQVRIIPDYKYIVTGDLDGEGDGTIELNVGGEFTRTVMWDITGEINFDEDFFSLKRGVDTGLKNDWNVFFNVTTCDHCAMKARCCPGNDPRKIARSIHEDARDLARALETTGQFAASCNERKKVEMLFGHMKKILKVDRLRLRGLSGARDEFFAHGDSAKPEAHGAMAGDRSACGPCRRHTVTEKHQMINLEYE